jgi:hypothetical protein
MPSICSYTRLLLGLLLAGVLAGCAPEYLPLTPVEGTAERFAEARAENARARRT